MNDIRKENGLPDVKNGEHRILQKQIDLMHEDVKEIKKDIKIVTTYSIQADTRSRMHSTLFKLFIPIILGLACGLGYVGYLITAGG